MKSEKLPSCNANKLHALPHPDYGVRSSENLFELKIDTQLALCKEAIRNSHKTDDELTAIRDNRQRSLAQEKRLKVEMATMAFFELDMEALALSPAGKQLLLDFAAAETEEKKNETLEQIKIHLGAIELEIEKNRRQLKGLGTSNTNETLLEIRKKEWGINSQNPETRLH